MSLGQTLKTHKSLICYFARIERGVVITYLNCVHTWEEVNVGGRNGMVW